MWPCSENTTKGTSDVSVWYITQYPTLPWLQFPAGVNPGQQTFGVWGFQLWPLAWDHCHDLWSEAMMGEIFISVSQIQYRNNKKYQQYFRSSLCSLPQWEVLSWLCDAHFGHRQGPSWFGSCSSGCCQHLQFEVMAVLYWKSPHGNPRAHRALLTPWCQFVLNRWEGRSAQGTPGGTISRGVPGSAPFSRSASRCTLQFSLPWRTLGGQTWKNSKKFSVKSKVAWPSSD